VYPGGGAHIVAGGGGGNSFVGESGRRSVAACLSLQRDGEKKRLHPSRSPKFRAKPGGGENAPWGWHNLNHKVVKVREGKTLEKNQCNNPIPRRGWGGEGVIVRLGVGGKELEKKPPENGSPWS